MLNERALLHHEWMVLNLPNKSFNTDERDQDVFGNVSSLAINGRVVLEQVNVSMYPHFVKLQCSFHFQKLLV